MFPNMMPMFSNPLHIKLVQRKLVIESMLKIQSHKRCTIDFRNYFGSLLSRNGIHIIMKKWNDKIDFNVGLISCRSSFPWLSNSPRNYRPNKEDSERSCSVSNPGLVGCNDIRAFQMHAKVLFSLPI